MKWVNWTGRKTKKCFGETVRDGDTLIIKLNKRKNRAYSDAIDTVIHEYAHCLQWGMAQVEAGSDLEYHDHPFWCQYGTLHNNFHILDGAEDSKRYDY